MTATATTARPRRRLGPGWVPNQHGAWAMLATPLLVGILASHPRWAQLPLTLFWFAGYFAFFAGGLWLTSHRQARYVPPLRAYAVTATVLGLLTLVVRPGLARWAPLFVLPMGVALLASARRRERSIVSGLATSVGSALMTLVAYDAGDGHDWHRAWLLTAVLAAYWAGTVLYVKTMVRERGSEPHYWLSAGYHDLAALVMIPVSPWLVLVFAVLAIRATVVPAFRAAPKLVGLAEIVPAVGVAATALLTVR